MKIEDNSVVRFHYTVSERGQGELESSRAMEPLSVLIGGLLAIREPRRSMANS